MHKLDYLKYKQKYLNLKNSIQNNNHNNIPLLYGGKPPPAGGGSEEIAPFIPIRQGKQIAQLTQLAQPVQKQLSQIMSSSESETAYNLTNETLKGLVYENLGTVPKAIPSSLGIYKILLEQNAKIVFENTFLFAKLLNPPNINVICILSMYIATELLKTGGVKNKVLPWFSVAVKLGKAWLSFATCARPTSYFESKDWIERTNCANADCIRTSVTLASP